MNKVYTFMMIPVIIMRMFITINIYGQPVCSDYMEHYWKLEESNPQILFDSAGTLNASAIVNPARATGRVGFAQSFNGLAEVNIPDDNSFDWNANSSFTIEFWMNKSTVCPAPTTANNNVIIGRDDPSTQLHWWIGVSCTTPGRISFNMIPNNGIGTEIISKTGVIDGNWHHIAVVRDGVVSTIRIYIDGIIDTTKSFTFNDGFASNVPVNVGWLNLSTKFHYNGILDELALYDRAVSASEITDHYNSGTGKPYCIQAQQLPSLVKILPLGNSITFGSHTNDVRPDGQRIGYRLELFNKLQQAGYSFDFVGSETAGQDLLPDPQNGGFPGINKEQMVTLLQTGFNPRTSIQEVNGPYLDFFQPDVILLHIGTNDLTTNITAIEQILDIVDAYRLQSGKLVKLLIAKIINRQTFSAATSQYNTNLENAVLAHNNSDNIIVDMETGAGINYSTDMIDNLHPNSVGYGKMATKWFNTLTPILGTPPTPSVPGTPSSLISQALSHESVQLNWTDNSLNENGFRVERKTGSGAFSQVAQLPSNTNSYLDEELTPSTTYTYKIYAFNNTGNSGFSNQTIVQTPAEPGVITNLAPGKPSVQSSTAYGGVASRANDNNTNGNFSAGSVSHTGSELSPYWQIDLQASYSITDIEVWNRTNSCCIARMANFYVFVSDNPFISGNLNTTLTQPGVTNTFNANYPNPTTTITANRSGRYVRVQLANQGELSIAEVRIFGSSGAPTLPAAPTNLTTQAVSSASIQLNWVDQASNETGFRVERKTGSGSFSQVAQLPANTNSYLDPGLTASTSYTYRVYAHNDEGNSGFSNESTAQTPSESGITNLAPGKPSVQSSTAYGGVASRANDNNTNGNFSSGSVSHTGNELSPYWQVDLQASYSITDIEVWNRTNSCCIARMANFYVFVSDNPFISGNLNTTLTQPGVTNTFNANYPNPSTTIAANRSGRYVRVQLANQGELSIAEVRIFGSSGAPTQPAAPTNLTTQALSSTSVQLNWVDHASNETGFRVERKTGSGSFSQIVQLPANTNSYLDNGLTPSTSYTYRVYAHNDEGNSGFSNESTVQTPAESGVTNLAPGKPSMQSSTAYGGVASRANDNNTNGNFSAGSVSHTANELSPYWQIDLQASYSITDITIWNRTNSCCIARMANFYVFVSDNPFISGDLNTTLNQSGVTNTFNANYPNPSTTIAANRIGRYVRVQLANQGELNIAEVQIFGESSAVQIFGEPLKSNQVYTSHDDRTFGLSVFPNPSVGEINIQFQLNEEAQGFLGIYDLTGRLITIIANGKFQKGTNTYKWDIMTSDKLSAGPGIYLVKLVAGKNTDIKKVIISK